MTPSTEVVHLAISRLSDRSLVVWSLVRGALGRALGHVVGSMLGGVLARVLGVLSVLGVRAHASCARGGHVACEILHQPLQHEWEVDVIFIHGLHGSTQKTWRQGDWFSKYGRVEGLELRKGDQHTQSTCSTKICTQCGKQTLNDDDTTKHHKGNSEPEDASQISKLQIDGGAKDVEDTTKISFIDEELSLYNDKVNKFNDIINLNEFHLSDKEIFLDDFGVQKHRWRSKSGVGDTTDTMINGGGNDVRVELCCDTEIQGCDNEELSSVCCREDGLLKKFFKQTGDHGDKDNLEFNLQEIQKSVEDMFNCEESECLIEPKKDEKRGNESCEVFDFNEGLLDSLQDIFVLYNEEHDDVSEVSQMSRKRKLPKSIGAKKSQRENVSFKVRKVQKKKFPELLQGDEVGLVKSDEIESEDGDVIFYIGENDSKDDQLQNAWKSNEDNVEVMFHSNVTCSCSQSVLKQEEKSTGNLQDQEVKNYGTEIVNDGFDKKSSLELTQVDLDDAGECCGCANAVGCPVSGPSLLQRGLSDCWPRDWIPLDCPGARVISLSYCTDQYLWRPMWLKPYSRSSLESRAAEMARLLRGKGAGTKPIVWVGHSKGGLFIKHLLATGHEQQSSTTASRPSPDAAPPSVSESAAPPELSLLKATRALLFLSVPHRGSPLANITLKPLLTTSTELHEIQNESTYVLDLHARFLRVLNESQRPPRVLSCSETRRTLMGAFYLRIVSLQSADLGVGDFYGLPLDHREICKPTSRECFLYKQLLQLIREHSKK